uniref:Glucanase n=1 Tax=Oryza sativa TaxID=4530 RepID=O22620_ORYSA|nr:glucanase [Oryza sativa Japonica Group]
MGFAPMLSVAVLLGTLAAFPAAVHSIGVCYGVVANNLPGPSEVVQLYRSKGIDSMRIYFADAAALNALSGSNIGLIMDVGNGNLSSLASSPSAAAGWVRDNIQAYPGVSFRYIAVGNEVQGSDTANILPAMRNVNSALVAAGLGNIKVSTSVKFDRFADTFPPSNGRFRDEYMTPIAKFLATTGAPLLANVYPTLPTKRNRKAGRKTSCFNYATFQPGRTVVDNGNRLTYTCFCDAMVDSIYAALEKAGTPSVSVVVSESGWPSAGGKVGASVNNAQTYNQGLINHVRGGTPKKRRALETNIFAMFDENGKPGDEIEKHFGLFNPNKSPSYSISF